MMDLKSHQKDNHERTSERIHYIGGLVDAVDDAIDDVDELCTNSRIARIVRVLIIQLQEQVMRAEKAHTMEWVGLGYNLSDAEIAKARGGRITPPEAGARRMGLGNSGTPRDSTPSPPLHEASMKNRPRPRKKAGQDTRGILYRFAEPDHKAGARMLLYAKVQPIVNLNSPNMRVKVEVSLIRSKNGFPLVATNM